MPQVNLNYRWYVLYTRCNHEGAAQKYLNRSGIECYLPMHRVLKQRSDRKLWLNIPVFRSYVFVRVSCREYEKAIQDFSLIRYVNIEGNPCVVSDEQITAIKAFFEKEVDSDVDLENPLPGDEVIIQSGPLNGCRAQILERAGKNELILRMVGTGQSMVVHLGCDNKIKKIY